MKIFGYEITIKKVHPKARKSPLKGRKKWTTSETNTMLRMRSEGKSTEEIAQLLNRTAASVHTRLWKIRNKRSKDV